MGSGTSLSAIQANIAKMSIKNANTGKADDVTDITDLVPDTAMSHSEPMMSSASASVSAANLVTSPKHGGSQDTMTPEVFSPSCQMESQLILPDNLLPSGSAEPIPISGSTSVEETPTVGSLPNSTPSLVELQNPHTFEMGDATPPSKRKITKANFNNKAGSLAELTKDPTDPLGQLDPLWTMKSN